MNPFDKKPDDDDPKGNPARKRDRNPYDDPYWDDPEVLKALAAQLDEADQLAKKQKSDTAAPFSTSTTSTSSSSSVPLLPPLPSSALSDIPSTLPPTPPPPRLPTPGPLSTTVATSSINNNSLSVPPAPLDIVSTCLPGSSSPSPSSSSSSSPPSPTDEAERKRKRTLAAANAPPLQGLDGAMQISVHQFETANELVQAFPDKTVMCGGGKQTISVTKPATEVLATKTSKAATSKAYVYHSRQEVQQLCNDNNHQCKQNKSKPHQTPDFHADKQLAVEFDNRGQPLPPSGDSRDMCEDCQAFFARYAVNNNQTVIVTDPHMTRVFHPDGSITKIVDETGSYYPEVSPSGGWQTDKSKAPTENSGADKTKVGVYTEYPDGTTKTWLDGSWKKPPGPGPGSSGLTTPQ